MGHKALAGGRQKRHPLLHIFVAAGLLLAAASVAPVATAKPKSSRAPRPSESVDHLVVRMARPADQEAENALAASVGGRHTGRVRPGVFDVAVARGKGKEAARRLKESGQVTLVEPDVRFVTAGVRAAASPAVNERCFVGCVLTFDGGSSSRTFSQSDLVRVGGPEAWTVTKGDPNLLVAVVDTDVDASQPDLAGKVIVGRNFSGDDAPDPDGHGTAVAGIISAQPNNGIGIAGLGWATKVLSVRVLDSSGAGLASKIAAGIRYAADYPGVRVVNLSLQQETTDANRVSSELADAITYAQSRGLLVVAAAGNTPANTPAYPADFPGVISVAAVQGSDDTIATYSRRGTWVDIAAPGVGVLTLATPCQDGNCWVVLDGTSFATPFVSAAAALVMAANPTMSAEAVAGRILSTADRVAGTGVDFSNGRLNAARAVGYSPAASPAASPPAAVSTAPPPPPAAATTTTTPTTRTGVGYWLVASDGGIFSYGGAAFRGSTGGLALNRPIVGLAGTPSGNGYWMVASDGGIFSFGDARFYGSTGTLKLNRPIVGMARTKTGKGYWLVASDGGMFAFGDAVFHGSTGNMALNRPIVGMTPTASGGGYWLVASDGGIFAFGDAIFHGSTGALRLNRPIVSMTATPTGRGYWLVASDGGIFAFGDARFYGSPASAGLGNVAGMASTANGDGYWIVGADGAVFSFGAAPKLGSLTGSYLNRPIVGLAVR